MTTKEALSLPSVPTGCPLSRKLIGKKFRMRRERDIRDQLCEMKTQGTKRFFYITIVKDPTKEEFDNDLYFEIKSEDITDLEDFNG